MREHHLLSYLAHMLRRQAHPPHFPSQHLLLLALSFQGLCLLLYQAQVAVVPMHLVLAQEPPQVVLQEVALKPVVEPEQVREQGREQGRETAQEESIPQTFPL